MLTWVRRRLQGEGGISLVEMMIALMILTISMFALLGGLIASATSVLDQQLRAEATRVATQTLEAARTADFDDLDIDTTTQTVTTANGREMVLERTIAYIDAFNPMTGTNEDVKQVTVVVSWSDRGRDREVTYSTAIAPPDPAIVGSQTLNVSVSPGAVEVGDDGVPLATVTLTAIPDGFTYLGNMSARWYRENGTLATVSVPPGGAPNTWELELPPADITWGLDHGENVEVEIRVVAGSREGTAMLTLHRPEDTAPGPTLSDAVVSPDPILLTNPPGNSSNCGTTRCRNVHAVTMSVQATPFDGDQVIEGVVVEFDLRDATSPVQELLAPQADGITWVYSISPNSVQIAPGSSQPFNFYAIYDGGQVTVPLTVLREVRHE